MITSLKARPFKPLTVRWRGEWWSCDVQPGYAAVMTAAGYCHIGPERMIASSPDGDPRVLSIDEAIEREILRPWGKADELSALWAEARWRAEVFHLNGHFQCVDTADFESAESARWHISIYRGVWIEGDDPAPYAAEPATERPPYTREEVAALKCELDEARQEYIRVAGGDMLMDIFECRPGFYEEAAIEMYRSSIEWCRIAAPRI